MPNVVEFERLPKKVKDQKEVSRKKDEEKVIQAPKPLASIPRPPPPFTRRLARRVDDSKLEKFYDILKQLSVNIPFVEAFQKMSHFAKYLNINLIPLSIYNQAGLGMPRPISMRLQMADHSIKRPVEIVDDVLVKVGKFLLPADFFILDCAIDKEITIILGRPFLATGRALMESERNEIKIRFNDEEVTFQASEGMKLPNVYEIISVIDVVNVV
uniref:Uncharacterized protein n=1 Tax=Nicotiana tabacum TaxID=4097 RepID=A0A1S4DJI9_TOBAC|nr:PREDICTED: uncharacterized protein LOC107830481 [Nicotiana tabacum]